MNSDADRRAERTDCTGDPANSAIVVRVPRQPMQRVRRAAFVPYGIVGGAEGDYPAFGWRRWRS